MQILETERLLLRHLQAGDLDDLHRLYADPEVRRYFPEGTLSREETREELEYFIDGYTRQPQMGLWATVDKASGRFIGRCGLLSWNIDQRPEIEVAYMLARDCWGRGLGTEAARGILQFGFDSLGLSRLICLIDADNLASIRVATNIGMSFEKAGRDDKGPYHLYARNR